jgi:hypothetical protein
MASWPGTVSGNWSGYAGTAGSGVTLTYASGLWHVPAVQAVNNTFSAMWVGIDGLHNSQLIQTGTEQDVHNGQVVDAAWWEILPAPEKVVFMVHPGDQMSAFVKRLSGFQWRISISDITSGQSFSLTHSYFGPGKSAEWILERPLTNGSLSTLAHYSPTGFRDASIATNSGAPGNPGLRFPAMAIAMRQNGRLVSFPSRPTGGNSFNLAYGHQPAAP